MGSGTPATLWSMAEELSPASFRDYHLCRGLVELGPEISIVEDDLDSIPGHRFPGVLVGSDLAAGLGVSLGR